MKDKYLKLVHRNINITLITILISIVCEIFFETISNYDYLILIVLYLLSKFVNKKSSCILMIIASVLLIVESLIGLSSIFNVVFLILGIIGIYHSICCLKSKN